MTTSPVRESSSMPPRPIAPAVRWISRAATARNGWAPTRLSGRLSTTFDALNACEIPAIAPSPWYVPPRYISLDLVETAPFCPTRYVRAPSGAARRLLRPGAAMVLDGTPMMSPNCWQAIHEAAEARGPCRYLEWGTGNSTLAMLRTALERWSGRLGDPRRGERSRIRRRDDGRDRRDLPPRRCRRPRARSSHCDTRSPVLLQALRPDPLVPLYEAQFLKVLWRTRNDDYWIMDARPRGRDAGRLGGVHRSYHAAPLFGGARAPPRASRRGRRGCRALTRERRHRAGTRGLRAALADADRLRDLERESSSTYAVPQLRNRIWHRTPDPRRALRRVRRLRLCASRWTVRRGPRRWPRSDVVPQACAPRQVAQCRRGAVPARRPPPVAPGSAAALQSVVVPARPARREGDAPPSSPEDGTESPRPPQVRSGRSVQQLAAGFDRELFFYVAPDADST